MADSIPAMLEPGEYVLNRNAAMAIGKDKLDELNYEEAPREGYQFGGQATGLLGSLLGLTQKKDEGPVYPKPDYGEMMLPNEEVLSMIMGGSQMGQGGIRAVLSSNKEDILKKLAKMRTTGKGSKQIAEAVDWQAELKKYIKQAISQQFTNPIKKQRGGSIDDFSLMDYMMPAMDKRLGPPLKRMKMGGDPNDPKFASYMTSFSGAGRGGPQDPQSLLQQPSGSFSTGIGSIFQEVGLQTPGEDYLETLSAYDPTRQQRLQQDYGAPGIAGGTTFAESGAELRGIGEKRELETMKLQRGAQDLRKQYREGILAQIAEDIANDEYTFTDLA